MTTNVIKQIVNEGEYGAQTIRMVVRSNERGPRGEQGERGVQGPQGLQGPRGADGAIQYKAGVGINISDENIITATGDATAVWGGLEGNIADQADLAPYIKENAPIWYGTCSTANGTLTKVVAIQNGTFSYTPGGLLIVYFRNDEQATSGISLQIDGVSYEMVGLPWAAGAYVVFAADMHSGEAHKMFYNISGKAASPGNYGPTKLYNGYDSTSIGLAPTANALKSVYDAIGTAITTLVGSQFVDTANIKNNAVTTAQIVNSAVTADKITLTHATDTTGWTKLPISNNVNLYMNKGKFSVTMTASSWTSGTVCEKPDDLDTDNPFWGFVCARADDNAVIATGMVDHDNGKANVQRNNVYAGSVTTDINWQAFIVEITS